MLNSTLNHRVRLASYINSVREQTLAHRIIHIRELFCVYDRTSKSTLMLGAGGQRNNAIQV